MNNTIHAEDWKMNELVGKVRRIKRVGGIERKELLAKAKLK